MLSVEVFCSLALLATLAVQVTAFCPTSSPPPRCRPGLIIDCGPTPSNSSDIVWSVDGNNVCLPILSSCLFQRANCARYQQRLPLLTEVSKKVCQPLCVKNCADAPKETICAHRQERYCTFPSQCELSKYFCNTGEYWQQEGLLSCGKNPQPCFPNKLGGR